MSADAVGHNSVMIERELNKYDNSDIQLLARHWNIDKRCKTRTTMIDRLKWAITDVSLIASVLHNPIPPERAKNPFESRIEELTKLKAEKFQQHRRNKMAREAQIQRFAEHDMKYDMIEEDIRHQEMKVQTHPAKNCSVLREITQGVENMLFDEQPDEVFAFLFDFMDEVCIFVLAHLLIRCVKL